MPISREQYSRTRTTDLETSMALAIARLVGGTLFPGPGGIGTIAFVRVYEEWADFNQDAVTPAAAVLPEGELMYGPSHMTPALLEDTWEPRGESGFGLYELSEASRSFQLTARAASASERDALKAGIEELFVLRPDVLMKPQGQRYGLISTMPEYYGLPVRLSLGSSHKGDDPDSVQKNIWEALFTVRAEAPHVVVGPVQPFRIKVVVSEVPSIP